MKKIQALCCTLIMLSSAELLTATVDCRAPRTRQQRVVCASPELFDLDRQLSAALERAKAVRPAGSEQAQLEYEQTAWELDSGGCWDRVECIRKRYVDRIAALERLFVSGGTTTQVQPLRTRPDMRRNDVPVIADDRQAKSTEPQNKPTDTTGTPVGTPPAPTKDITVVWPTPQDDALTIVNEAANEELTRSNTLLSQAQGYERRDQIEAAQRQLAVAIDWDNPHEIQAKTTTLAALNREFDEYIRQRKLLAGGIASGRAEPTTNAPAASGPEATGSVVTTAPLATDTGGRTSSQSWTAILLVLLALDWIYCFSKGWQNRIVLYFDGMDVFISILGPLFLCAAIALHGDVSKTTTGLLAGGGVTCALVTIRSSIKHNRSFLDGCAAALFKLSFAFLWFTLLFGQLGRGADYRKGSFVRYQEMSIGMVIAVLLFRLMKRLINGRAVYAIHGWQA
jgi:uncharacterized protein